MDNLEGSKSIWRNNTQVIGSTSAEQWNRSDYNRTQTLLIPTLFTKKNGR